MTSTRFNRLTDALAAPWSRRATLAGAAGLVATLAAGASTVRARSLQGTPGSVATTGITTEVLGQLPPPDAPGQTLSLRRIVFQPGASLPAHTHPGSTIYWIESGTLGFTLLAGEASIVRGASGAATPMAAGATATPAAGEALPVGTEITATAGDVITFGATAAQTERAMGDTPLVIMLTNLAPTGAPFREPVGATPAA